MSELARSEIAAALAGLGIEAGSVLFVHSALSSLGHVAGGAETVVEALLDRLGPSGTLVVPTFTFAHNRADQPIFDLAGDRSEMGRISEAVRTRPGALRSRHLLHSVAALGRQAHPITAVHGPSAWAADGPFGQLHLLDARILLLGVPYLRCTFFHVLEQLVQVPYRHWWEIAATLREDGREQPLSTCVYSPRPGFQGNDFNKFGRLLEQRRLVRAGAVGNAVARCFRAQDAVAVGLAAYRADPALFLKQGDEFTPVTEGVMTGPLHNEKWVLDPAGVYGSGGDDG